MSMWTKSRDDLSRRSATLLKQGATYADLCAAHDRFIAEILDGDLYGSPRLAIRPAFTASVLSAEIGRALDSGCSGPTTWLILNKVEVHFGHDVLVPDIAGWRRERLPALPLNDPLTLAPDWVCEILSEATEAIDRGKKLRIYAREGVAHCWLVDSERQALEVLSLESQSWTLLGCHEGRVSVSAVPFDAIELDLGALWNW
jgi:Uma2 family endonuclease